ncbi:MAG: serine/threonine protein kinase [Anaerolineae bacterium]|nr:serine/threonine protein kinase [Anaerolineae bacterium]
MSDLSGKTIGKFRVIEEIGRGGMANVYRAIQPSMGREVAIKVMPAHLTRDATFLARFNREVQVISQLEHPSILPVYDFGEENGQPYIVMRYLTGGSLSERIKKTPEGLPLKDVVSIVEQMASALDFAHERGVTHRDFKPSNVLLDERGHAYLADFGIAKVSESTLALTGSGIIGTPGYIAPEVSREGHIPHLLDVYALGVTVFEMITGQTPYQADTPMGTLMAHISAPIPNVHDFRSGLPEAMKTVIDTALAKDPTTRYQTAGQLAADLKAVVEGHQPVGAEAVDHGGYAESMLTEAIPARDEWGPPRVAVTPPAAATPYVPAVEQAVITPEAKRRANPWLWGCLGLIGLVAVLGVIVGGILLLRGARGGGRQIFGSAPTPVPTATLTPVPTAVPTELDYTAAPSFGSVDLARDFLPDPFSVGLISGGPVNAGYIDGCSGYAAAPPDFRLFWGGSDYPLHFFFVADDPNADTTLIISDANGIWHCNDDFWGYNPNIDLYTTRDGQIDIWVGSIYPDDNISGTLYITEMEIGPDDVDGGGGGSAGGGLDWELPAAFGDHTLESGFVPDPYPVDMVAGGTVDVYSELGGDCLGFVASAPDVNLYFDGSGFLRIYFIADDAMNDPTLVINEPDGTWVCMDDAVNYDSWNPVIDFQPAAAGWYAIWVGTYTQGETYDGTLYITELDENHP